MLDPGDEVLAAGAVLDDLPRGDPARRRRPVQVLADETQDYKVTVDQLEAARTERTKVLLFCSPSNPTGAVYTADEVAAIGRWVEEHALWVVTDEIYEHLVVRRRRDRFAARCCAPSSPTSASSSTASPRPTR